MFFLISTGNGDTRIEMISKGDLEKRLNEGYYGDSPQFLDAIPNHDTAYWPEGAIVIIQGKIVVPHAEHVVTRYVV